MRLAQRVIASLFLTAALAAPVAIMAAPAAQEHVTVRVYDRDHRQYHNWDDNENHAWGMYLDNNHRRHYEYSRASRRDQRNYWNWRHDHPDGRQ
jgi:hypothetical protein